MCNVFWVVKGFELGAKPAKMAENTDLTVTLSFKWAFKEMN